MLRTKFNAMATIVTESAEILNMIDQTIESKMRSLFLEFGITKNNTSVGHENEWINLEDAKRILPIKSRKKWKELRDYAKINFAKAGKGFVYQRSSLEDYLINSSTVPKSKRK
jgi:hypothetical protein